MQRLQEVLEGREGNYLMPFFWQHGAEEAVLREYMGVIHGSGIGAVCVEARPHPDFLGAGWWHDLDIIMDEARNRGMRVWVLDDAHFPTGYAAGAVRNADDRLKRWSLAERMVLVDGPVSGCRFEVASHLGYDFVDKGNYLFGGYKKEELVAVIAGRRREKAMGSSISGSQVFYTDFRNLTELVDEDGYVSYDFPPGNYALFIYTKRLGAAATQNDYISFLEKDSCRLLIDTVYEPHYRRYKDDFGRVFAGFFSDEPGFYNLADRVYGIGRMGEDMPLPWTDSVEELLYGRAHAGAGILPGLFHSLDGEEKQVRYAYMDIITEKYQHNFSDQIGDWCEERGVEYIGHAWEDGMGNRSLGAGHGHYFRALHGQHMSGIDAVINDLLPGRDYGNGFFYHYELAVLAASAAHQSIRMRGRAMCEIFGAYGWSEGLTLMKWLADHMLVNGINHFVPHAFSDMAFPDPDNPPHFYAGGMDPQFRYMHVLFHYMNRMCHLLNGGKAVVDTAVLFPAETDWAGGNVTFGRIGSRCLQNQIPYEVVCLDRLKEAEVKGGRICIGQASYKILLVDHAAFLPEEAISLLSVLKSRGAEIYFVGYAPMGCSKEMRNIPVVEDRKVWELLEKYRNCSFYPDESFADGTGGTDAAADDIQTVDAGTADISANDEGINALPGKWLRCYQYAQDGYTVYMLFHSSVAGPLKGRFLFRNREGRVQECLKEYDALSNRLVPLERDPDGSLHLVLDKGEARVIIASAVPNEEREVDLAEKMEWAAKVEPLTDRSEQVYGKAAVCETMRWEKWSSPFTVSIASYDSQEEFTQLAVTENLADISEEIKGFAGRIRYENTFMGKRQKVFIGQCSDGVEVFVNGKSAGIRIAPPYLFEISELAHGGENLLRIETATTLTNVVRDGFSMDRAVRLQGALGDIMLR